MAGLVDDAHATAAELAQDFVVGRLGLSRGDSGRGEIGQGLVESVLSRVGSIVNGRVRMADRAVDGRRKIIDRKGKGRARLAGNRKNRRVLGGIRGSSRLSDGFHRAGAGAGSPGDRRSSGNVDRLPKFSAVSGHGGCLETWRDRLAILGVQTAR